MYGNKGWKCVALGSLALAAPAGAQSLATGRSLANAAESDAVSARSRPDYDAIGLTEGAFSIFPSLQAQLAYDTNIFNSDASKRADEYVTFQPDVSVRSNWSRNSLSLDAGGLIQRYHGQTAEDNDQYHFKVAGAYSASQAVTLNLDGGYARDTEPRGSLGDLFIGGQPSRYDDATANGQITTQFTRFTLTVGGGFERLNYLPVFVNGTDFSESYRNVDQYNSRVRIDYAVGPGLRTFVSGSYNLQRYDQHINGINQNSHGYNILGGLAFGITDLISGEVGIGYISQSYTAKVLGSVGGVSYNGKLIWNPTKLVTLTLSAAKSIQQSPFVNESGIAQDNVGLTVDYELLSNLIISLSGVGTFDRYRGLGRSDSLYAENLNIRYLINRYMEAGLSAGYRSQSSSGTLARRYSGASVSASLTLKR